MKVQGFWQIARHVAMRARGYTPIVLASFLAACASSAPPRAPAPHNPFAAIDSVVQIDLYETQ